MKAIIIKTILQVVMGAIALGVGIWYLASSIDGASLPYVSLPRFLNSIGACKGGVCDIAGANGCFLCPYVEKLFFLIGTATEGLWDVIIDHTWIILVIGLVVFMFWKAYDVIMTANKQNASLGEGARTLHFKQWFDAVKGQFIRVMIVAALMGAAGFGGRAALQAVADSVVYPVMYVGTSLSMAATGVGDAAVCGASKNAGRNPMAGVSDSFKCVIGNLSVVILSGASSGFAMMDFAWLGMGGGFLTWLAGLFVVIMFLYIGYNVMFKVLNIAFNLVFVIVFIPLFLALFAFENVWKLLGGATKAVLEIFAQTAVRVVGVTIEIMILSSIVTLASQATLSSDYAAEYAIIEKCEKRASPSGGKIDRDLYAQCFEAEKSAHPSAFRNLDNGWEFLTTLLFLFLVYYFLVDKKLQKIIGTDKDDAYFKFGDSLKTLGTSVWKLPAQVAKKFAGGGGGKAPAKK